MTNFNKLVAGGLLSLGWLNPIHNPPWPGFVSDVLVAFGFLLLFYGVAKELRLVRFGFVSCVLIAASLIPILQFCWGEIPFFGVAWINALYLIGGAYAVVLGENWKSAEDGQLDGVDFVLLCALFAGCISVFWQFQQLFFPAIQISAQVQYVGQRYAAGLGNPNLLATLLVWAALGLIVALVKLSWPRTACFLIALILIVGLALTQSRAGLVNAFVVLLGTHLLWRSRARPAILEKCLVFFAGVLVGLYLFLPWAYSLWGAGDGQVRAISDPVRLALWGQALVSLRENLWTGVGWGALRDVFLVNTDSVYRAWPAYSHNLFLDVFLYCGLPVGLLLVASFLIGIWRSRLVFRSDLGFVGFLAVLVVVFHAMLEYPLHYAFFLLPFGIVFGSVLARTGGRWGLEVPTGLVVAVMTVPLCALLLTVWEGLKAEKMFNQQRADISFLIFDQWEAQSRYLASSPSAIYSKPELDSIRKAMLVAPTPYFIIRFAESNFYAGDSNAARYWFGVMCNTSAREIVQLVNEQYVPGSAVAENLGWQGCALEKGK